MRYSMHRFGESDNILLLGRDLRPLAEMQQQLVMAQVALERDYETQREMDTRYRVLMEATRDAVVLVAMSNGRISDLNASAAVMLVLAPQAMFRLPLAALLLALAPSWYLAAPASRAALCRSNPARVCSWRANRPSACRLLLAPSLWALDRPPSRLLAH